MMTPDEVRANAMKGLQRIADLKAAGLYPTGVKIHTGEPAEETVKSTKI